MEKSSHLDVSFVGAQPNNPFKENSEITIFIFFKVTLSYNRI